MELGIQAESIKNQNKSWYKELRKESTDLKNRILSIHQDSLFVRSVHNKYQTLPLIPNLRCGGWYTPPTLSKATAYFKSTDGHTRQWRFSLKRSNLEIVDLIQKEGGAVLVDSTRRGKSIPDALSKTVPIWSAVLNQASHLKFGSPSFSQVRKIDLETSQTSRSFTEAGRIGGGMWLSTPKDVVGASEHEQIAEKIDDWVQELLASDLPIPHLKIPLVPIFLTPDTFRNSAPSLDSAPLGFYPLILLSTSHSISSGQTQSTSLFPHSKLPAFTYVQGAGDDHESWSQGLTPAMFWDPENHNTLLECGREEIESKVKEIVENDRKGRNGVGQWFIPVGSLKSSEADEDSLGEVGESFRDARVCRTAIYLGQRNVDHQFSQAEKAHYSLIIHCSSKAASETQSLEQKGSWRESTEETQVEKVVRLGIEEGKKGVHQFASSLPNVMKILETFHRSLKKGDVDKKVLICSSDGKDLPGSFAIAFLSIFLAEDQSPLISDHADSDSRLLEHKNSLTKAKIQKRLEWLITSNPNEIPSRSHLKRINEWLLSPKGGRFS